MKKLFVLLALTAMLFGNVACVSKSSPSFNSANLDNLDFSDIETMKKGKACSARFLGLVGPLGSRTLLDATKDARIRKVKYVETSRSGFPLLLVPVVYKSCITAYGE